MTIADRCAALPPLSRRIIAFVVVPSVMALLGGALVMTAAAAVDAQRLWREETKELLSQAAEAPAQQAALEKQLASMRQSALWSKFYTTSGSGHAAASLQADVAALVNSVQAGGQMLAPIPAQETSLLVRHGVRVTASLRINQLQDLLNATARHARFLKVEQLTVVAPHAQPQKENPPLAVTMDIYGYELARDVSKPGAGS